MLTGGEANGKVLRSALFVDFDNVFIGLRDSSPRAAEVFSRSPEAWLGWLSRVPEVVQVPSGEGPAEGLEPESQGTARRLLLTRNCYLNPVQDTKGFRAFFTRAGFRVVDCPSLTQHGKSSADIHMVMDILDILAHPVRYDEVIVMSADADFTAVMLRLRSHDRRTVSVSSSPVAHAYRAACDLVVSDEEFTRQLLGLQRSASSVGVAADGGLSQLSQSSGLPEGIEEFIEDLVRKSPKAVSHASIASQLMKKFGRGQTVGGQWFGYGAFGDVLGSLTLTLDDQPLVVDFATPGYVLDPARHSRPVPTPDATEGLDPDLAAFITAVHSTTGMPKLAPATYRGLFEQIHAEVRDLLAAGQPYVVESVAGAVAQRCYEAGIPVTVSQVKFVLRGYELSGYWRGGPQGSSAADLANASRDSALARCVQMGIPGTDENLALLDRWLVEE
ncbi:hypothetical protein ABH920_004103 [Catenulispora sp. EB89]|uniref:NYN domain-containing protein n=1 Tax=Catenulispora sp. EB89 TaxID=3156257 RepID=UPI003517F9B9